MLMPHHLVWLIRGETKMLWVRCLACAWDHITHCQWVNQRWSRLDILLIWRSKDSGSVSGCLCKWCKKSPLGAWEDVPLLVSAWHSGWRISSGICRSWLLTKIARPNVHESLTLKARLFWLPLFFTCIIDVILQLLLVWGFILQWKRLRWFVAPWRNPLRALHPIGFLRHGRHPTPSAVCWNLRWWIK